MKAPTCKGCLCSPCFGTHARCNLQDWLEARVVVAAEVEGIGTRGVTPDEWYSYELLRTAANAPA